MKCAFFVLVTVAALSGCYARSHFESNLTSWDGRTAGELFEAWGSPTSTFDLPDGGKMYTWANDNGGQAMSIGQSIYAVKVGCRITFTIGASGRVEAWRYQGNNCY